MIEHTGQNETASGASLIGRERIRGATRVIPEGTAAAAVAAEQIAAVAADALVFIRAHKIPRKAMAKAVGYSESTLSEFFGGVYKGVAGQVAIDIDDWLAAEEQRRLRPQSTVFVWSNVAMLVKATAMYALDHKTIGLVYSPDSAGVGKTTAMLAVHQLIGPRRSALATMTKADANPSGCLRRICQAIHCERTGGTETLFRRIVDKLKGRSHLLMIDQIHALCGARGDKPLFLLSELFDATGAAQLWTGTTDCIAYLNRQRIKSSDESLAQIRSRIYPAVDLMTALRGSDGGGQPLVTIEQVREMFSRNQLRITSDAGRFLCAIINLPDSGSIRACVQFVGYASMLAEMAGTDVVDVTLIRQAMKLGLGEQRAEAMIQEIEKETTRLARVG
jgi:DNA transposition AAA+ family ATPase